MGKFSTAKFVIGVVRNSDPLQLGSIVHCYFYPFGSLAYQKKISQKFYILIFFSQHASYRFLPNLFHIKND